MSDYEFIFDNLRWSFSNLKSFEQCPFEWLLKYVECERGVENIYGQFGSLCHNILEQYLKGEMPRKIMLDHYVDNFNNYVEYLTDDKYGTRDKLYRIGYEFFEKFNLDLSGCKIIGVEQKLEFDFFTIRLRNLRLINLVVLRRIKSMIYSTTSDSYISIVTGSIRSTTECQRK